MQIDRIKCCNRDAEEQEDKNSIWLKEADLSTLSVDKEVKKQELDSYSEKKRKCSIFSFSQALKKAEEVLKKKQDKKDKAVGFCLFSFSQAYAPPS